MSPIYTCQLCGATSFDYPSELQRHAEDLASQPAAWTPWNYRQTLQRNCCRLSFSGNNRSCGMMMLLARTHR